MKAIKTLISILMLFCGHCGYAQQKGSFNATIPFMSGNRTLSCYVPQDYDSTQQYRLLIGLHGSGDNSTDYRNVLISARNWPSVFTNTIIVCPDGGEDAASDFYAPWGDQEIIESAIQYAKLNYTIDSTDIILQGFSLGGRSALKYGLDNTSKFKGLILNTPAIQDVLDLENEPLASLIYNYEQAFEIPIYIITGQSDAAYITVDTRLAAVLKKQNGIVDLNAVLGMQHTIPVNSVTTKALAFIENPSSADYDLDLFEIDTKDRHCADIQAKCHIRNTGNAEITSVTFNLQYGSNSSSYTWTGSLLAYQHEEINLPAIAASNGIDSLKISIGAINTSQTDPDLSDNTLAKNIEITKQTNIDLLLDGFDDDMDSWFTPDRGSLFGWYTDTDVKYSGTKSFSNLNTPLFFYTRGVQTEALSPAFNISGQTNPTLRFDMAFNYLKYTPPYVPSEFSYADTLEVYITTDCGNTFQRIYRKGGAQLATAAEPKLNELDIEQCVFVPAQDEWRQEIVDLKPYANSSNAYLKFNYISGMGGSLHIDNLRVGDGMPMGTDEQKTELSFNMYPNPANDRVTVSIDNTKQAKVRIYDSLGKTVLNEYEMTVSAKELRIDISRLENGFYIIEVNNGVQQSVKKLLVNR